MATGETPRTAQTRPVGDGGGTHLGDAHAQDTGHPGVVDFPSLPRRGGRATLAERSAASGIGQPIGLPPQHVAGPSSKSPASSSSPPSVVRPAMAEPRHVWVTDPPGIARGTFPGLLAQWERRPEGWAAYVVVAVPEGPDVATVHAWIPAAHLRPA